MVPRNYERLIHRYRIALVALLALFLVGGTYAWVNDPWRRGLNRLNSEYTRLSAEHSQLEQAHDELTGEYERLVHENAELQTAHQGLTEQLTQLTTEYQELQKTYADLNQAYSRLNGNHENLASEYESLIIDYGLLSSAAVTPPYIVIEARQVHLAFLRLDGTLVEWLVPFESLEEDLQRGYEARKSWLNRLNATVTLETEGGETYTPMDFRPFVDPAPFTAVMRNLYETSTDDATFIREVWNIVTQLSTYSTEIEETPRYPLETLLAGGGDCEDTSILLASMIQAAPVDWKVSMVYMDAASPEVPRVVNHLIVHIDTGEAEYLIETTTDTTMEPYTYVNGWYIPLE